MPRLQTRSSGGSPADVPIGPQIGIGQVRHTRLRPARNAFAYPTYFLLLPMRQLKAGQHGELAVNRWAPLSFHDRDHGDGRSAQAGGALAWLDELLAREGINDASGEVWLHCYPRVLGYAFKPVSFWYCHRTDGTLRAVVVEVNNTFGERHCYLLDTPRWGAELRADKVFHVSPFCSLDGGYRFRFLMSEGWQRTVVRIDYDDADGPLIQTSVSGSLQPLTAASARHALWHHPAMTLGVIARIHWQALKLWLKRVRFFRKPPLPDTFVTRQDAPGNQA
ncbi:DUF1365 domain-containing protein [Variovorax sp. VNK109]|uniref:DUF1365 domain-containing protein n=1 Tax=Variovorax sp. VNK109 TaxID=3400919 RepID=UPI003C00D9F2